VFVPCLVRYRGIDGDGSLRLGHRLLDDYLEMVASRARPNTVLATAFDLKVFFDVVGKDPEQVGVDDVLGFIKAQRLPRRGATVVRLEEGESGLAARTIKRRLSSVAGLYEYLRIRGAVTVNPVPRGLSARTPGRAQSSDTSVPCCRRPRRSRPRGACPAGSSPRTVANSRHPTRQR
jgi:integrase/recombinase XerD